MMNNYPINYRFSKSFMLLLLYLCLTAFISDDNPCKIMLKGKFIYGNSNEIIQVIIDGSKQTEYHNNGKYYIRSKIKWLNDCEYNMTMTAITIPDFPYGVGDKMNIKINKVVGREIHYTSTIKGKSWEGILIKQD